MFQKDFEEDGSVTILATNISSDSAVVLELPNVSHTLDMTSGDSVTMTLEEGITATLSVDGRVIEEFTGMVSDEEIESKVNGIEAAQNRYLAGHTWILEFENEIEEALKEN